ncbi:hypothetical protein RRG08_000443 [Elysia crispata]|uniref:Uncharacterized protein n=1 Tax=Elysia crispata TaxID=231223 RepID=A0AAE1CW80_9GAST|nr:hypothetical protein RRG08_000443 [Elysia crispata]
MKTTTAIILAVFCAAVIEARSVQKRDFWDDLENILDKGIDRLEDFSVTNKTDIVDKVLNSTVILAKRVRGTLGKVIDNIRDTELDDIVDVVKNALVQAGAALNIDDLIETVRNALGSEVDNIDDDDLKKVVATVDDSIKNGR